MKIDFYHFMQYLTWILWGVALAILLGRIWENVN